jgi:hypothetical protein
MDGGSIIGGMIMLFLGGLVALAGYRLFVVLLPIYGFFVGISLGAHSVQALFGDGFLSTTTSWVVGFFVGLVFAVLSYLFWVVAVAIMAGSFGYAIVAALFGLFDADLDVLVWIAGMAVGIVFAVAAILLNLQKAIVIVSTAFLGAWAVVGTFLLLFGGTSPEVIAESGAKMVLDDHPLWILMFAVIAAFGMVFQFMVNRGYEIERYNRWQGYSAS